MSVLKLVCPHCGCRVKGVALMTDATQAVDRTCSMGHMWRVIVRPLFADGGRTAHRVDWQLLAERIEVRS